MNIEPKALFKVVVNGRQSGCLGKWNRTLMLIISKWDAGSDQEKFEVLAAIRRTYSPENTTDIRGSQQQTPSQIGRREGFTELRYERSTPLSPLIIIVPSAMQHSRSASQPSTDNNDRA